jgi:hypothetical protein
MDCKRKIIESMSLYQATAFRIDSVVRSHNMEDDRAHCLNSNPQERDLGKSTL